MSDPWPQDAVRLVNGPLATVWLPGQGMVGASLTHEGQELLGQRGGLEAYLAKGSAFGIPLLHPWANRLSSTTYTAGPTTVHLAPGSVKVDGNGLPKDGVLAGRAWSVESAGADHLTAGFVADEPVLRVFPFPHRLTVTVRLLPDRLRVTTSVLATGAVAVPLSLGWHPLLTLPGVAREDLEVTLPVTDETVLDDRGLPTGERRAPEFVRGRLGDRVLDAEHPRVTGDFVLRGGGRELVVRFDEGYPVGHVWAPAGESFVAWEPMTAPTDALVRGSELLWVEPGASWSATFSVHVRRAPS